MQIVSALFVENFEMRQAPGPSTRIDMTGVMFSQAANLQYTGLRFATLMRVLCERNGGTFVGLTELR